MAVAIALVVQPSIASADWGPATQAALPSNAGSNPGVELTGVGCASAGNCTAIGSYIDGSGNTQGLLLTETSGTWAPGIEATLPTNAGSNPGATLYALSCSAGDCTAAGYYTDNAGHRQGLLLTETSGTWAAGVEANLPGNAGSSPGVILFSVSCPSAGNCAAVGYYTDNAGHQQGLLLTEASGIWAVGVEATPPGNHGSPPGVYLSSVSCPSAGTCTVVGFYVDSSGHTQGLLLTETSGTWGTGVEATLPANAGSQPGVDLAAVSCPATGSCTAVGDYVDGSGNRQALMLDESSGTWATALEATLPASAGSNPNAVLDFLSCTAVGNCTAGGRFTDASGNQQGLLQTETSGTWAAGLEASLPANASGQTALVRSVWCSAPGDCGAVGVYTDGTGDLQGLLLTETSGTWAAGVEASPPGGSSQAVAPIAVSCPSAGTCSAVGAYKDGSGNTQGLLLASTPPRPSDVPVNVAPPTISGTPTAGDTLSCSAGSWTNSPTAYAYRWSFDGTPIAGATAGTYTVQSINEGVTLTCTVTAFNATGAGNPATSHGVLVPVPRVAGCPPATGILSGTTLGLLHLGMTRGQARRAYTHSSTRGQRYEDFFCLSPRGVRVGYASPTLLKSLPKAQRRRYARRVIWASTACEFYAIQGIRPGATLAAAAKAFKLEAPFHIGLNDWYLAPERSAVAVLKVRHGIVQEIGIGDKALSHSRRAQSVFLLSFD